VFFLNADESEKYFMIIFAYVLPLYTGG